WGGLWRSVPASACCSPRCSSRRSSRACRPRSGCCARTSAPSTTTTVPARGGSFREFIEGPLFASAESGRTDRSKSPNQLGIGSVLLGEHRSTSGILRRRYCVGKSALVGGSEFARGFCIGDLFCRPERGRP